jgi:hypothetical protein
MNSLDYIQATIEKIVWKLHFSNALGFARGYKFVPTYLHKYRF